MSLSHHPSHMDTRDSPQSRLFIKFMIEFSLVGFFSQKNCLVESAGQRDTRHKHTSAAAITGGGMGTRPKAPGSSRICHSAASSLSDHIKLIMKLHFEQLQNLLAGRTPRALPRKGENTQKEQISLGVLWKSSREHNSEEMFCERITARSAVQELLLTGGLGCFFPLSPRKTHVFKFSRALTAPAIQIIKENRRGLRHQRISDNTFH